MMISYRGRDARVDVDPEAGSVTVTPSKADGPWSVPLGQVETIGVRRSTLLKRGTLRLLVRGQSWTELSDSSPNAVAQLHAVPHGLDDDPIAFASALAEFRIPMVTLDAKGQPMKVGKPSNWGRRTGLIGLVRAGLTAWLRASLEEERVEYAAGCSGRDDEVPRSEVERVGQSAGGDHSQNGDGHCEFLSLA
ncbi:hypothetical protein [Tsukamurella pseudospumae]|uniref:Uncharacterized protein n=1 Tax=Tsukamurella pseudospumae TaxID=239498 RepID=A0A138AEB4_9ACTN|nr:hypothetical protein [Tsukamurella pseudospumae]KXP08803.1 hypothetical protein AXK60_09055 [Tsukamurella pseudospumae]